MKKILALSAMALFSLSLHAQGQDMDSFLDELMSKMTVEEKIGQLNLLPGNDITTGAVLKSPLGELTQKGELGAVLNVRGVDKVKALQDVAVKKSRLGIPLMFGQDVIHGNVTVMPIPLALSCSWDLAAIQNSAAVAAKEASAQGINWAYSPMVDIALDPRWGRIAEGSGEDPYLGARIAEAMIHGLQGVDAEGQPLYGTQNLMACVKHYALYGAVEAGRDYNTVDMSRLRMYNQYFPPYKAAAEAGAGSFMSSFNLVDGIPATANRWLINDVLRGQWGFKGMLVTDYGSIGEMTVHGMGDAYTCAALALKGGTDMDMCSSIYTAELPELLKDGKITMEEIDQACRRVLECKYKLGLFKDPYRFIDKKRVKKDLYTDENRKVARDLAAETFVLLKNDDKVLPLKKQGTIALIGPMANDRSNLVGCWSTGDEPSRYSTVLEAMERTLGQNGKVIYAQGCNICDDSVEQAQLSFGRPLPRVDADSALSEAVAIAQRSDVVVACLGEMAEMTGESSSRADLTLPAGQKRLLKALLATGKPVVMLNFTGRPTVMTWEAQHVNTIMNVWFGGSEMGDALCDVLFGDKVPTGKLTTTLPQSMGQIPLYYNHLNTGRPVSDDATAYQKFASNYMDVRNAPLFPFGFGLSYTTYQYGDVSLSTSSMPKDGTVTVTCPVTNTGSRDGEEIVQLYIRDLAASIARPVKELKAFHRVPLKAGETKTVSFTLSKQDFSFYDANGEEVIEPGDMQIMVGPNSRDVKTVNLMITD